MTLTATLDASTAGRGEQPTHWVAEAACREVDAPSMFADHWGVGADARRTGHLRHVRRAAAGSGQAVRVRIRPPVPTFRAELGHSA